MVLAARQQRGWRQAQNVPEGVAGGAAAENEAGADAGSETSLQSFSPPLPAAYRESLLKDVAQRNDLDVENVLWWFKNELNARFFQQVPMHIAKTMVRNGTYRSVQKGEVIVRQGDRAQNFFVVISGKVNVHIRDDDE